MDGSPPRFRKIFGEEVNKPLLIDFLNAQLPVTDQIVDLTFKSSEQLGQTDLDRKAVATANRFDFYCENEKGEKFTGLTKAEIERL